MDGNAHIECIPLTRVFIGTRVLSLPPTDPVQPLVQRREPPDGRDLLQLEGEPHQRRHEVGAVRKVPMCVCVWGGGGL